MADDYYPEAASEEKRPTPDNESEEPDEQTFLVPKSALKGKEPQPGETCKIEAVHVYDGEIEFKYVPHDEKKESDSMAEADRQMDSMASGNSPIEEA
jgi:hypothetical protein